MIAEFDEKPFSISTLMFKIDYHNKKIKAGKGELLYSSLAKSILDYSEIAQQVAGLNDRVKYPYHEVSINLPKGESLSNDRFVELSNRFMAKMKYDNTAYIIVRHTDKDHDHVHILFTTIELDGKKVDRYNERRRSQKISRELEKEFDLKETVYNKFEKNKFSEIKAREYYFHHALMEGIKSYQTQIILKDKLKGTLLSDFKNRNFTNGEYELILGTGLYEEIGAILEKGNFFNPLFKDELISILDICYPDSRNMAEFKKALDGQGIYMRLVSKKGKSNYVYGLPNVPIYFNDTALPKKYRYGEIALIGKKEHTAGKNSGGAVNLSDDEQKHLIYNVVFLALYKAKSYEDFKKILAECKVNMEEHESAKGGLIFNLASIDDPISFNASDISKTLEYAKIIKYYTSIEISISKIANDPIIVGSMREATKNYIPMFLPAVPMLLMDSYESDEEDDLEKKKKKKKKKRTKNTREIE